MDDNYLKRSGQNLQGIINDLKRRPEDAAAELEVPLREFTSYLRGETAMPAEVITRATKVWPVNERDFYCLRDDAPTGIKIMRSTESARTSRIMERAGKPYYEYRDTACSSVSQFRPEWIKELCIVDNNDPENPEVQWNNGHFMHQFTYFVGPVNFYYRGEDGKKKVAVMNTGDSMYITPFVPHTFATRKNDKGEYGLILALTYGNKLAGETQQELSALGSELASQYAMDFSTSEKTFASLLHFHRESASMDLEELARRSKLPLTLLEKYESGEKKPWSAGLESIAEALNIDVRELMPSDYVERKVIVRTYKNNSTWNFPHHEPAYKLVELAATHHLPHSKAFEFNLLKDEGSDRESLDLKVGLHQYVYNVGKTPVNVNWYLDGQMYHDFIQPDDSLYIKPFVPHKFRGKDGKLLVLRIGGRAAGESQRELSLIGKENAERAVSEMMPWFNKEGRNKV